MQGQALLPGAAMFEMAASAACMLVLPHGQTPDVALLGVSIPAPLPLAAGPATTLLSVTLDAASGRLVVQSQDATAAAARTHVTATAGSTAADARMSTGKSALAAGKLVASLVLSGSASQRASGTAVADVQRPATGQAAQYNVHPAVLDNVTQVRSECFAMPHPSHL